MAIFFISSHDIYHPVFKTLRIVKQGTPNELGYLQALHDELDISVLHGELVFSEDVTLYNPYKGMALL